MPLTHYCSCILMTIGLFSGRSWHRHGMADGLVADGSGVPWRKQSFACWEAGAPGASQRQRLVTAGRQLLDAAIFHAAHVEGLAAVGSACSSSKKRPEIQEQDRKEEEPAKGAEGGAKGHAQAPTYLCLTFQVPLLCSPESACCMSICNVLGFYPTTVFCAHPWIWQIEKRDPGALQASTRAFSMHELSERLPPLLQVLSRAVGEADLQKLAVLLSGLPWLLVRFKAAMKRHATAVVAGMREGLELRKGRSRDGGQSGGVPAAADFDFFALLLEPVLTGLESAAKVRTMGQLMFMTCQPHIFKDHHV